MVDTTPQNTNDTEKKKLQPEMPPGIKSLRTYQGDIENIIGKNKVSATTIAVAEQKRALNPVVAETRRIEAEVVDHSQRNKIFVFLSIALICIGLISVGVIYFIKSEDVVMVAGQKDSLLAYNMVKEIPLQGKTREQLSTAIREEVVGFSAPTNSLLYIHLMGNATTAPIEDVSSKIGVHTPEALNRTLDNQYMLGVYSFDVNAPFIILTVSDYGIAYASMLEWEKYMVQDLAQIFGVSKNDLNNYTFKDESVKNKDLRIAKNENNKTLFLYSFINKNTILITLNQDVFSALLGKFNTKKLVR